MQSYYQMHEYVNSSGAISEIPAHTLQFYSENDGIGIWDDWGLIPASVPMVKLPEVYSKTIEIPGTNNTIDLSNVLLGFPTYKRRTGSWSFYVDLTHGRASGDYRGLTWDPMMLYTEMATYLHGQVRNVILLDDDPDYYYTGKFKVGEMKRGKGFPQISIDYDLEPYKTLRWTTCSDWLWDPFDFLYGEITKGSFYNIPVNITPPTGYTIPDNVSYTTEGTPQTHIYYDQKLAGIGPVFPKIIVSQQGETPMTMYVVNRCTNKPGQTFTLNPGENNNPQIMFVNSSPQKRTEIVLEGQGYISFDFTLRRL